MSSVIMLNLSYSSPILITLERKFIPNTRDIETVSRASSSQWQAAAWKLERRNPSRWGKQRIEAEIKGGIVVEGIDWLEQKIDAAKGIKGEE